MEARLIKPLIVDAVMTRRIDGLDRQPVFQRECGEIGWAGQVLHVVDIKLLLPKVGDLVHDRDVDGADAETRPRDDIDGRVDVGLRHGEGQGECLDPVPRALIVEVELRVLVDDHGVPSGCRSSCEDLMDPVLRRFCSSG